MRVGVHMTTWETPWRACFDTWVGEGETSSMGEAMEDDEECKGNSNFHGKFVRIPSPLFRFIAAFPDEWDRKPLFGPCWNPVGPELRPLPNVRPLLAQNRALSIASGRHFATRQLHGYGASRTQPHGFAECCLHPIIPGGYWAGATASFLRAPGLYALIPHMGTALSGTGLWFRKPRKRVCDDRK